MDIVLRSIKKHWPDDIKEKVSLLRTKGYSFGYISSKFGVAKSTLHSWTRKVENGNKSYIFNNLEHLKKIRKLAVKANLAKRTKRLDEIDKHVEKEFRNDFLITNKYYLKSLVSMLYWAEGSKNRGSLTFANTDPKLALLYITLLRRSFSLDESKFRVRLHLHSYHNIKKTITFWSKLLNIPTTQFGKIYLKKRSESKKFRKNFAGICFIRYYSEALRYEIMETAQLLSRRIAPIA